MSRSCRPPACPRPGPSSGSRCRAELHALERVAAPAADELVAGRTAGVGTAEVGSVEHLVGGRQVARADQSARGGCLTSPTTPGSATVKGHPQSSTYVPTTAGVPLARSLRPNFTSTPPKSPGKRSRMAASSSWRNMSMPGSDHRSRGRGPENRRSKRGARAHGCSYGAISLQDKLVVVHPLPTPLSLSARCPVRTVSG